MVKIIGYCQLCESSKISEWFWIDAPDYFLKKRNWSVIPSTPLIHICEVCYNA